MARVLEACPDCGSVACLVQSPEMCRHTGRRGIAPESVQSYDELIQQPMAAMADGPPQDKQVSRGKPSKARQK